MDDSTSAQDSAEDGPGTSDEEPSGSSAPPWDDSESRNSDYDDDGGTANGGKHQERDTKKTDGRAANAAGRSATDDDAAAPFQPFPQLAELPDDLAEAFESFKLAIVRHRLAGWQAIAPGEVVTALEWLRHLVLNADGN
jgi:hypothetical protein